MLPSHPAVCFSAPTTSWSDRTSAQSSPAPSTLFMTSCCGHSSERTGKAKWSVKAECYLGDGEVELSCLYGWP